MAENQYEFIKKRLAPCGLHCGKCFAFTDGDISNYSKQLKASLGNFDVYAARFVELLDAPIFLNRYRRLERTNKYQNATFVAWM